MRGVLVGVCLVSALAAASCNRGEEAKNAGPERIRIVTTIGMITDMVENVGGDRVAVTGLMGPGVDPHLYKASAGDVSRMARADMIVYNGLHLEGKMTDLFEEMGRSKKTLAVTDGIDRARLLSPPAFEGAHDPHVWFDVGLWMQAVAHLRDALAANDPAHASVYRVNARQYLENLSALDEEVRTRAGRVPEEKRVVITAHDAFNYFGRAYGFEVRGLQGISTAAEAGTADVKALAGFIFDRKIPAVFVETSVPARYIEALQAAVRARGFEVAIGGQLFSDAMGSPGTPEGTYVGMVRHNIETIVRALSKG